MSLTTQEKIELLNKYSHEVVYEDFYEFPEEYIPLLKMVDFRKVIVEDGDYSVYATVELDGELFLKIFQTSSWVGEYGDSDGFLPAEKYTYTEERYRHV